MTEEEFKKLLEKQAEGTLTEREDLLLESFFEKMVQFNSEKESKNLTDRLETKKSIWKNVNAQIKFQGRGSNKNWIFKTLAAAAVIGFIISGYLYLSDNESSKTIAIPENVITLELEDGTLNVIDETGVMTVTDVDGNIIGHQKGSRLTYGSESVSEKPTYNTLTVPYGKTFELALSDGTSAYLNAGSSLRYPTRFVEGKNRHVFITGEAYLDVAKDSLRPFIITADNLDVKVLGTQFNIMAYPEDHTSEVVLVEGSVRLYDNADSKSTVILEPGFKGSFNKQNKDIAKDRVITSIYTSWVHGELIFRNMTFENILKKLERHYDVQITNNNKELSGKLFNANFGNQPLENVLKELQENYDVDFKILNQNDVVIN